MKKIYFIVVVLGLSVYFPVKAQFVVTDLGQQVQFGHVSAMDIDGDGDLDLLIGGESGGNNNVQLYLNNGGVFTPATSPFMPLARPSFDWGDINNDGKPDLITNGFPAGAGPLARVYTTNGTGTFTQSAIALPQLAPSCGFADLNNDGYTDIFVFGNNADGKSKILFNNKVGGFTESAQFDAYSFVDPVVSVVDFDNDKDLDLFITAGFESGVNTRFSKMFVNNNGIFTAMTIAGLFPKGNGSAVWGDYNSDGYLDLLLNGDGYLGSGEDADNYRLYRNNGGTSFTAIQAFGYRQNMTGNGGRFADWDNDGDLDIIVSGYDGTRQAVDIYLNNAGTFTAYANNAQVPGSSEGSIEVADIDADSDLDLLITGYSGNDFDGAGTVGPFNRNIAVVVKNPATTINVRPNAPTGLTFTGNQAALTLSWTAATDATTPQAALSYNLFVRNITTGQMIYYPLSDTTTGKLSLQRMGNVQLNKSWIIKGLPVGTYRWGVQAVDNSFMGSLFAKSGFIVNANGVVPIVLTDFTAIAEGKKAKIEWTTSFEQNNDHFDIERSIDGTHFTKIATVKSSANGAAIKQYQAYDNTPANGINFYRLTQVDNDGKTTIHGIKSVNFRLDPKAVVTVYPNPSVSGIGIRLSNYSGKTVSIMVTDVAGKMVHQETMAIISNQGYYKLNMTNPAKGQYLIKVMGEGMNETIKAVVQ